MSSSAPTLLERLYSLYAPVYDWVVRLASVRREAVESLHLEPGDRVAILGAGTGADLEHLPAGVHVVAGDVSTGMLRRLRRRAREVGAGASAVSGPVVEVRHLDAHDTGLATGSFDAVLLHLIVAVVPDGRRCMQEAVRIVRPGGRISVLDKFAPDDRPVALWRRILNPLTRQVATSIVRRFGDLVEGLPVEVVERRDAALGGLFEWILLRRTADPAAPATPIPSGEL